MRKLDLTPLLRATVGFDRMMGLLDASTRLDDSVPSYPPYNIEKTDQDRYRITMAVAGFGEAEIDVTVQEHSLVVKGKKAPAETTDVKYLYRGIATRAFERSFELADHITVTGAKLENGLLFLDLVREIPEAKRPRGIKIDAAAAPKVLESQAA